MDGKVIIQSCEVVCKAPHGVYQDFDHIKLEPSIIPAEECHLVPCIGCELYEALINDLNQEYLINRCEACDIEQIDFEALKAEKESFYFLRDNKLIQYFRDSHTEVEVKKFNSDCFNKLWNCGLCDLLAFSVLHNSAITSTFVMRNSGAVKNKSDNYEVVSQKELAAWQGRVSNSITAIWQRVHRFLIRPENLECFKLYPPNKETLCACEPKYKQSKAKNKHAGFA